MKRFYGNDSKRKQKTPDRGLYPHGPLKGHALYAPTCATGSVTSLPPLMMLTYLENVSIGVPFRMESNGGGKNALLWNGFLLGVAVAFSRKNNVDGTVANGELQQGTDAHAQ